MNYIETIRCTYLELSIIVIADLIRVSQGPILCGTGDQSLLLGCKINRLLFPLSTYNFNLGLIDCNAVPVYHISVNFSATRMFKILARNQHIRRRSIPVCPGYSVTSGEGNVPRRCQTAFNLITALCEIPKNKSIKIPCDPKTGVGV